jgi:hypothetical protein
MLSLLRNWLFPKRRAIFSYWDGKRWRAADPLVAARRLITHETFDWESHPALAEAADDFEALQITVDAVREVFDVPAFESGGLTQAECVELLGDFTEYLHGVKKNTSPSPISSPPTAPATPSITSNSPDSGSTSDEPKTEPQSA